MLQDGKTITKMAPEPKADDAKAPDHAPPGVGPKNTDPYFQTYGGGRLLADAHRTIFGPGARVEGPIHVFAGVNGKSVDEEAWDARPKSKDYGKDINLPAKKK